MNLQSILADLHATAVRQLGHIESTLTYVRSKLTAHDNRLDAHDAALRSDSTEIADLAARVERLEGAAAPPPDPVEPPDPIDPTPPPVEPERPVEWAASREWAQIAGLRRRMTLVVREPGRMAAQLGLRDLLDRARAAIEPEQRSEYELILILPPGECGGLKIASESIHAQGAVGPELGEFAALHVIAEQPPLLEAVVDGDPDGPVKVHPSTALGMCERSALNMQRRGGTIDGFRIAFYGIELRCGDRTGVLVNTGGAVGVEEHHCSMSIAPGCDPTSVKWGHQLYRYGLLQHTVSANLAGNREHFHYGHLMMPELRNGYATIYVEEVAGQAYQWTARPVDVEFMVFPGVPSVRMENAIIRDTAQHAGRAGSALTLAGAAMDIHFEDVLVLDDDPTDTEGAPKPGTYGGLTIWAEGGSGDKSEADRNYRPEELKGRANGEVTASGLVIAGAAPNRPLMSFDDVTSVRLIGCGAYAPADEPRGEIVVGQMAETFLMRANRAQEARSLGWATALKGSNGSNRWTRTDIRDEASETAQSQPKRYGEFVEI